ncbi:MAG TPA: LamG domain-containing protein [Polyangiales bacterium]|nr:LamG domain-containing protein [Polyangiales bacterium]
MYDAALLQDLRAEHADAGSIADPQSDPHICNVDAGCESDVAKDCDAAADGCERGGSPNGDSGAGHIDVPEDQCPGDPHKLVPGMCGCGQSDVDTDTDGTPDCMDGCPRDARKTAAQICGCGTADTDSDADGTVDCIDACPEDANKTSVGACGCGTRDLDADDDGTVDCLDMCPQDAAKTSAGMCGCGQPEPSSPDHAAVFCTKPWLLHRYRFEGGEAFASDSVGSAHAQVVGGDPNLKPGAVTLSGDSGPGYSGEPYVELPRTAWPSGDSATFETWVLWQGAAVSGEAAWQRIFDFGDQFAAEGYSYVALTPDGNGGVRASFSTARSAREVFVISDRPLAKNVLSHVAVVIDGKISQLSLYVDGRLRGSVRMPNKLSNVNPVNRWLGRSNWEQDPAFFGSVYEFRIYGAALTEDQLAASFAAGPDYDFSP